MANMLMRHRAQTLVTIFMKRNLHDIPITINELREHIKNIP